MRIQRRERIMFDNGFVLFIPFVMIYGWLLVGLLATSLLWWDAGLLKKDVKWYFIERMLLLTLLCIIIMPVPLWIVFKERMLIKFYKRLITNG